MNGTAARTHSAVTAPVVLLGLTAGAGHIPVQEQIPGKSHAEAVLLCVFRGTGLLSDGFQFIFPHAHNQSGDEKSRDQGQGQCEGDSAGSCSGDGRGTGCAADDGNGLGRHL